MSTSKKKVSSDYSLEMDKTKTSAHIAHKGIKISPTFTGQGLLISTIVALRAMNRIDEETHNEWLSEVIASKMPSVTPMLPSMNVEFFGMRFGTEFCEHGQIADFFRKLYAGGPLAAYFPAQGTTAV